MTAPFAVLLTQGAKIDLQAIYEAMIDRQNARDAAMFLEALLDKISTLRDFPLRGSIPPELEDLGMTEYRQIRLKLYRIIYKIIDHDVYVVMIADGRQNMQKLFQTRLQRDN